MKRTNNHFSKRWRKGDPAKKSISGFNSAPPWEMIIAVVDTSRKQSMLRRNRDLTSGESRSASNIAISSFHDPSGGFVDKSDISDFQNKYFPDMDNSFR